MTSLVNLPTEIILSVLDFLPPGALLSLACSCRFLLDVASPTLANGRFLHTEFVANGDLPGDNEALFRLCQHLLVHPLDGLRIARVTCRPAAFGEPRTTVSSEVQVTATLLRKLHPTLRNFNDLPPLALETDDDIHEGRQTFENYNELLLGLLESFTLQQRLVLVTIAFPNLPFLRDLAIDLNVIRSVHFQVLVRSCLAAPDDKVAKFQFLSVKRLEIPKRTRGLAESFPLQSLILFPQLRIFHSENPPSESTGVDPDPRPYLGFFYEHDFEPRMSVLWPRRLSCIVGTIYIEFGALQFLARNSPIEVLHADFRFHPYTTARNQHARYILEHLCPRAPLRMNLHTLEVCLKVGPQSDVPSLRTFLDHEILKFRDIENLKELRLRVNLRPGVLNYLSRDPDPESSYSRDSKRAGVNYRRAQVQEAENKPLCWLPPWITVVDVRICYNPSFEVDGGLRARCEAFVTNRLFKGYEVDDYPFLTELELWVLNQAGEEYAGEEQIALSSMNRELIEALMPTNAVDCVQAETGVFALLDHGKGVNQAHAQGRPKQLVLGDASRSNGASDASAARAKDRLAPWVRLVATVNHRTTHKRYGAAQDWWLANREGVIRSPHIPHGEFNQDGRLVLSKRWDTLKGCD